MRNVFSALLLFFCLSSVSHAASDCRSAVSDSSTLIQKVWYAGFDHPIYKRPAVQSMLHEMVESMGLDEVSFPKSGPLQLAPARGTLSLKVVGSYYVKDDVLTVQISEVQLVDQPEFSFLDAQPLAYGERPKNLNSMMGYLVAAVEGSARVYMGRSPQPLRHLRITALDIRSPSVREFLRNSNFTSDVGSDRELSVVLDY